MKIDGPQRTSAPSKTEKARKSGGVGSTAFADYLGGTEEAEAAAAPAAVGGVGLFLALQAGEMATEQEGRRRAMAHADDLLDELEDLRVGLLLGSYTQAQLSRLAARLQQRGATVTDPGLQALLQEVEMRAAIELAKYEQSS